MKRWFELFGWAGLGLGFVLLAFVAASVWWGESTRAASPQVVVELPCPSGYSPITALATRNRTTDAIRYPFCIRETTDGSGGRVLLNGNFDTNGLVLSGNVQLVGELNLASNDLDSVRNVDFSTSLFASLGAPANGRVVYCSDCTIANPCAGGGTGAIAKRLNGAWVCN